MSDLHTDTLQGFEDDARALGGLIAKHQRLVDMDDGGIHHMSAMLHCECETAKTGRDVSRRLNMKRHALKRWLVTVDSIDRIRAIVEEHE